MAYWFAKYYDKAKPDDVFVRIVSSSLPVGVRSAFPQYEEYEDAMEFGDCEAFWRILKTIVKEKLSLEPNYKIICEERFEKLSLQKNEDEEEFIHRVIYMHKMLEAVGESRSTFLVAEKVLKGLHLPFYTHRAIATLLRGRSTEDNPIEDVLEEVLRLVRDAAGGEKSAKTNKPTEAKGEPDEFKGRNKGRGRGRSWGGNGKKQQQPNQVSEEAEPRVENNIIAATLKGSDPKKQRLLNCYNCGGLGHIKKNCTSPNLNQGSGAGSKPSSGSSEGTKPNNSKPVDNAYLSLDQILAYLDCYANLSLTRRFDILTAPAT